MNNLLIGTLALTGLCNFAIAKGCPAPQENSLSAFKIIKSGKSNLCEYLESRLVAKDARNKKCETMYHAAIKKRNYDAIDCLDSINYGVKDKAQVNKSDSNLGYSIYEWSVMHGSVDLIENTRTWVATQLPADWDSLFQRNQEKKLTSR